MNADPVADVLEAHDPAGRPIDGETRCTCGEMVPTPSVGERPDHRRAWAAHRAAALREAGHVPETTTRDQWGVRESSGNVIPGYREAVQHWARHYGGTVVRRTHTTYADHITEWEPAE